MKLRRCFWAAALLSLVAHAAVFASVYLILPRVGAYASTSLPILVVAYGDNDREGLAVDAVAPNAGTLRKGDANTPGGDGAPKAPADKPAAAPPPPSSKAAGAPKPDKPAPVPPPPPSPAPPSAPDPNPVAVAAADKPAAETPLRPAPSPHPPADAKRTRAAGQDEGGSPLPGASGGSRLPIGTPSAGGTAGSTNGVRVADGARPPAYPPEAREEGLEGTPVIWLRVSARGEVLDAHVQTSSGYKVLDDAALQWARSQKFIPARRDGIAVDAEVTKPVHFYLY